jgi:glycosyltransferase involved in cell wall biosynthesis
VVCVKNNKDGIELLLSKLLKQNHQNYEVIIVDDFSTDGLKIYLNSISSKLIKYIKAKEDVPGKKLALSQGINEATKDWILVTDSDCIPSSLNWISLMAGSIKTQKKEIILGYAPMHQSTGLIGMLSKYETAYVGMQYLSYALAKIPYMGVGRNMLFSKDLFVKTKPFDGNINIASGDDDFFIQKAANADNTGICIDANAHCYSNSPKSLAEYISQKTRHISTSSSYKNEHKVLLGIFGFIHIGVYLFMVLALVFNLVSVEKVLATWLTMLSFIFIIQYICYSKLNEQRTILSIIISDFLLSLLYGIVGLKTMFTKKTKWN